MKQILLLFICVALISSSQPFKQQKQEVVIEKTINYYKVVCNMGFHPNHNDLNFIVEESINQKIDPMLVLSLVLEESKFKKKSVNYNTNGSSDYGYFQLNDKWHNQYRDDINKHISYGISFLKWCLKTEKGNVIAALSRYNSGRPNSKYGLAYAKRVLNWKDIIRGNL
jgi:soluble lytic murein transglycosylase-like protein